MARARIAGIGRAWSDIWATGVWTEYVWTAPDFYNPSAHPGRSMDLRTLVVGIDKSHHEKVTVYEFSNGRKFHE